MPRILRGVCVLALAACLNGACNPGRPTAEAESTPARTANGSALPWSDSLPMLLPAIRTCLAQTEGATAATKAWPIGARLAGVRVLTSQGERTDCIVAREGAPVLLIEPVRASSALEGEQHPVFTPQRGRPPRGACYETVQAFDQAGTAVGWLSYEVCRHPRPLQRGAMAPDGTRARPLSGS